MTLKEYKLRQFKKSLKAIAVLGLLSYGLFLYTRVEATIFPGYLAKNTNPAPIDRFFYLAGKTISYYPPDFVVLGDTSEKENALSIPVLAYHGIVQETKDTEDVSWDNFKEQMFTLKASGYETITLSQFQEFLLNDKPLPKKSFLLTFDDGRKDSYYPVDPILEELDYTAVMFVITSRISDRDNHHLTKSELVEMLTTGRWELESHSENAHTTVAIDSTGQRGSWLTNKLWLGELNRLENDNEYRERIVKDMANSKVRLESLFSRDVSSFAFPYGDYGQNITNYTNSKETILGAARDVYRFVFYQPWGEIGERNYPGKDTFMIRRITVNRKWDSQDLLKAMMNGEDKNIGYTDLFLEDAGWITKWGRADISDGAMFLRSAGQTSGATTYLNGTELWDNYEMTAKIILGKDTDSFSIVARADRFGNYSYCNFGRYGASYNEKIGGRIITGNKWSGDFKYPMSNEVEVGIRVEGDKTACLMNKGALVKDKDIKIARDGGMIGFSIWSSIANAQAQILSIETKPMVDSGQD